MIRSLKYLTFLSGMVVSLCGYLAPVQAQPGQAVKSVVFNKLLLDKQAVRSTYASLASAKAEFSDIQEHWAKPFIDRLTERNWFTKSSKNTFQPNGLVTRAEFATILQAAFIYKQSYRQVPEFDDVPASYWAADAIKKAYASGFLSGFNDKSFRPNDYVTRAQAMVAIANGLDLITDSSRLNRDYLISMFRDGTEVPDYAVEQVAALTDREITVNYPEPRTLNLQKEITRAELAALVYQALAYQGRLPKIASSYIVDPKTPLFNIAAGQITRLEVNLSQRQVTAYQGDKKLKSYPVGVGRAGWETPTGTYRVQQIIANPAWKNPFTGDVIKSGDPDNPLGNYWIGFWTNGKDWSGFHGTPNRDSVGQAVSHGCIRMYNEHIQELFSKVTPNTLVKVIH